MGQRTRTVQSMVVVDGVLNRGRNREQIITILYLLFIDPEDQLVKNIEYISFPVLSCHQPDPSSRLRCICNLSLVAPAGFSRLSLPSNCASVAAGL